MHLNKRTVDQLPIPAISKPGQTAQKKYYDDELKGFGVRVTSGGTKAFFLEKLMKNKLRRITLGRYPDITVEQARNQAKQELGKIAAGLDPATERQLARIKGITLYEVFQDYLAARKSLKASTIAGYNSVVNIALAKWHKKPIEEITKDNVSKMHAKLGAEHGEAYANLTMRVLRALFNFAAAQYEDAQGKSLITENPTKRLSQTRSWYRVERRQTYIKAHQLKEWYEAVCKLNNKILRDYLLFILFTGLRRQEAATLTWNCVDLTANTLTIVDTKNHEQHVLPLSTFLLELLKQRAQSKINEYVFPGAGESGHLVEPRRQMARVIEATGIEFSVHDLRRTFITIAESLDISAYALKRLLNHKMNNDVTSGYIMSDVERLRKPMQMITDFLLNCMKITKNPDIMNRPKLRVVK